VKSSFFAHKNCLPLFSKCTKIDTGILIVHIAYIGIAFNVVLSNVSLPVYESKEEIPGIN
jgi:uncharacterized membrane protein